MFKSIFKKNKRPADQGAAPDQSNEGQQSLTNDKEKILKRFFDSVKPSSPEEYVVPVVEIERLWSRFQQLGPDEQGNLPDDLFQLYPYTTDPFVRQIWRTFPREENENVSFHSFVGVFMWWKTVSLDKKLRGIFKLLNGSQPLDVSALQQIIMKLENTSDENAATSKAELLVKKLDDKDQGFIDEDQWVTWISQLPEDDISKLTKFSIIPPEIAEYSNSRQPSEVLPESESAIPNEVLVNLVSKIGEKDWTKLAQELGFNVQEIRMVKKRYPHRSREQVYQMLLLWRQKMGGDATTTALNFALQNCGMEDIPELLSHQ